MAKQPKTYKKLFATAATATIVAAAIIPAVTSASSFKDVPDDHEFKDYIDGLVQDKIIKGYEDGTFKINKTLTRSDVVKLIGRYLENNGIAAPADWKSVQRFNDLPVTADEELVKYAALVKEANVFTGSNGNLNFADNIQRQQMSKVLNFAYAAVNDGLTLVDAANAVEDVKISDLTKATEENRPYIQALADLGITTVDNFRPADSVTRGQFAKFLSIAIDVKAPEKEVEGLKVLSAKAVNSSTLEVAFSQPINAAQDNIDNVKVVPTTNATTQDSLTYELSKDGKTLSIKTDIAKNNFFKGDYKVVVDFEAVKGAGENEFVPVYNETVKFSDTVAPTFITERVSALVYKVKFSEPMNKNVAEKITFKGENGKAVEVATSLNDAQTELTLTIPQDDKVVAPKEEITATIIGATDIAGNLINPNPAEFTMTKGEKDGVKPTVDKVAQTGAKTFTVKVSEELVGAPTVELGTDNKALVAAEKVEVDEKDPTLFHVTAKGVLDSAVYYVKVSNFTDLSGEQGEASTKLVEFKKDVVAPKVESSQVVKDDKTNVQYLELTLDKNVVLAANSTVTAKGNAVKNGVTTKVEGTPAAAVVYADANSKKVVRVALKDLLSGKDVEGADYNVELTFANVVSETNVASTKAKVEFNRGNDTAVATEEAIKVTSVTKGDDNNTVVVAFDKNVDAKTATNTANYSIDKATVQKAVVKSGELNKVYLTLEDDSNNFTGVRNATIAGVKADGSELVMETKTIITGSLTENVAPTVKSAKLNVSAKTIEITFSEAIELNDAKKADFEVYVDGKVKELAQGESLKLDANLVAEGNTTTTVTIPVDALTAADMLKEITIFGLEESDIVDANGNKVKFADAFPVTK